MRIQHVLMAGLLALTAVQAADNQTDTRSDAGAAFARLKSLVGEWEANTQTGKARVSYELTGAGTAVVERETADKCPP